MRRTRANNFSTVQSYKMYCKATGKTVPVKRRTPKRNTTKKRQPPSRARVIISRLLDPIQ